jgi:hypothetical protein
MHASPLSILFVGDNRGIWMIGWMAVGRLLYSTNNLKKLILGV